MKRNGFTLVELLVVIGIISTLIAILLPALNKARDAAKTVQCLSNERQIALAMLTYANDYGGRLPAIYISPSTEIMPWYEAILPYLGGPPWHGTTPLNVGVFDCPARTQPALSNPNPPHLRTLDYGVNYSYMEGVFQLYDPNQTSPPGPGSAKVSQIRTPTQTFMLMDSRLGQLNPPMAAAWVNSPYRRYGTAGFTLDTDTDGDGILDSYGASLAYRPYFRYNGADFRHDGNSHINAVFIDGHGETLTIKQWTEKDHWTW